MILDTNSLNPAGGASNNRSRSATSATTAATTNSTTTVVEQGAVSSKDQVVISPEAQNLVRLQAKIQDAPDVNLKRVADLRQAIAEGRFEINPERLAENMLVQDELLN
jgi:negative regulator of flagellin synthesis FlgM